MTTMDDHQDMSMEHTDWVAPTRDITAEQGDQNASQIADFLQRPILIKTLVWTVGSYLNDSVDPWGALLGDSAFIDKLNYFKLFRANMTITFKINGTPQHAGKVLCSYLYRDRDNSLFTVGGTSHLITRTQRPHCWLDAADNRTGCICVPWYSPYSWFDVPNMFSGNYNANNMGTVYFDSPATLKQTNAGADSISVSVFANFTDVQLSIPTVNVAASSGLYYEPCAKSTKTPKVTSNDEYSNSGVISGPAAAVADIAGMLKDAPVIGLFARATEIGANAVSGIARLFGFSKPRMIDDVSPMRNMPVSNLACVEGKDSAQSLALTAKQELTVDSRTVGFDGTDELSFDYWREKCSFLTLINWTPTDAVNNVIWGARVDPMLGYRDTQANQTVFVPTALGYMSRPFQYWSGSLRFRFQAIASKFHRGRVAIVYDPEGRVTNTSGVYNKTFTHIMDLSEERDFTVEIPWSQAEPYKALKMDPSDEWVANPAGGFANSSTSNGIIYMVVVTDLAISDGTTPVDFIVSLSAGPDYEVMEPRETDLIGWTEYYDPSSGMYYEPCSDMETGSPQDDSPDPVKDVVHIGAPNYGPMHYKSSVFFGERIQSARQLLKRYTFYGTYKPDSGAVPAGADHSSIFYLMPTFPAYYGYGTTNRELLASGARFNRTGNSFMNYFAMAFSGWRGSIRYKLVPSSRDGVTSLQMNRATNFTIPQSWGIAQSIHNGDNTTDNKTASVGAWVIRPNGAAGSIITATGTMNSLEADVPYQWNQRFSPVAFNTIDTTDRSAFGGTLSVNYDVDGSFIRSTQFPTFTAAGEDFSLFGFIGAPVYYKYGTANPT